MHRRPGLDQIGKAARNEQRIKKTWITQSTISFDHDVVRHGLVMSMQNPSAVAA